MTENLIELMVEAGFNHIDRELMAHRMTQEEYDSEARTISKWAEDEYRKKAAA